MAPPTLLIHTLANLSLAVLVCAKTQYTWPNHKIDTLESMLYEQSGFDVNTPAAFVLPCGQLVFGPGRSTEAEWLRTAYHDMATADVVAGTGGLDASIGFELADRDDNPGSAFEETLGVMRQFLTPQSSMADLIALGTVTAVEGCSNGKVRIPFRAGRIDATGPGPKGVPKPEQDLKTHTDSFKTQGFNQQEMIGLVACGHTLGGVHGKDFPEIVNVTKDPTTDDNTQNFDATATRPGAFDNNVAVQFVSQNPQNPLAFGHNKTTRSDARIFNADGGSLIKKMAASKPFFYKTCGNLLQRMIDTVPKKVTLTEEILPIEVKPSRLFATVNSNGTITVTGTVRLLESSSNDLKRQVKIHFIPRLTKNANEKYVTGTAETNPQMWSGVIAGSVPARFKKYAFEVLIPMSRGLSGFNVEVIDTVNKVTNATLYTNNGKGFPFDDTVITQPLLSCQEQTEKGALRLKVATRNDREVTSLQAIVHVPTPLKSLTPHIKSTIVNFNKIGPIQGTTYTMWSASHFDEPGIYYRVYDLVAKAGTKTMTTKFNEMHGIAQC